MDNFPNNSLVGKRSFDSQPAKEEKPKRKKFEAVIEDGATVKETSGFKKFLKSIFPEDLEEYKRYVLFDVAIPAGKKVIQETVDAILYGTDAPVRSNSSYTSYGSFFPSSKKSASRNSFSYGKREEPVESQDLGIDYYIEFNDIGKAKRVLKAMREALEEYGILPVAAMYEFAKIKCPFTYEDYGWTNLDTASVIRIGGGKYTIDTPRALPIR